MIHKALQLGISLCINVLFWFVADAHLENTLRYYETMQSTQAVPVRSKRSVGTNHYHPGAREVSFYTLGQQFNLYLHAGSNLMAQDFKLFAMDSTNQKREVHMNRDFTYQGVVLDEEGRSEVSAYWEDGDKLTATIKTKDNIYIIEPSWRHLPPSENYSLISYRSSDMKIPDDFGEKFCGSTGFNDYPQENTTRKITQYEPKLLQDQRRDRRRRRTSKGPFKNTCPMLLVADWKFFMTTGQRNMERTSTYLMNVMQRVNNVFINTDFGKGYVQMGFEVKEMWIHEEPTTHVNDSEHYNTKKDDWEQEQLLQVFSRSREFRQFCLAHLFTSQSFQSGVLGFAYIAKRSHAAIGGICSMVYHSMNHDLYPNCGWSSSKTRYGTNLLTREFDLVTTHELGHNWGSEHDPDECVPRANEGGHHTMYQHSVSGLEHNNKIFSKCSIKSIRLVLDVKSRICFAAPTHQYCGNGLVEQGEHCDGGTTMKQDEDECCEKNCTHRPGAVCSDMNDLCCRQCKIASHNVICHPEQPFACLESSNCTGVSASCPRPAKKREETLCLNNGLCRGGNCKTVCHAQYHSSCICDDHPEHYCLFCCMFVIGTRRICMPYIDEGSTPHVKLPAGTPCPLGYCNEMVNCLPQIQNLMGRLWAVVEHISANEIAKFMKNNIAFSAIFLSMFVWIPICCIIRYLDRKRPIVNTGQIPWLDSVNMPLVHPLARFIVRKPMSSETSFTSLSSA